MALIRRALRAIGTRRALVMADQGVSSLSNILVTIIAARLLTAGAFGAFSVALVSYHLADGVVRAAVGEPFLSAHSTDAPEDRARVVADVVRASLLVSVLASAVVGIAAWLVGDPVAGPLTALALVFPFLGVQDALRHVAVVDRPQLALASDLVWLGGVGLLLVVAPGGASPAWFVGAWGVAGAVALLPALVAIDAPLRLGSGVRWFARHRAMAASYLAETMTARAAHHVVVLSVGAVAGLPALGAVRAAQVFYGPLNTMFAGFYLALVPDGARRRDEPERLVRFMGTAAVLVTGMALAWTTVGMLMPDGLGVELFGSTWAEAETVMLPMGLAVMAGSVAIGAFAGLRSLSATRYSLGARLASVPPQTVCTVVGAAAGGAVGYAIGFAVGNMLMAVVWWVAFMAYLRRQRDGHRADPDGGSDPTPAPATDETSGSVR